MCHLWNLVAAETREGEVYERLLSKNESIRYGDEPAFAHLGGTMVKREKERYEITLVPPAVRDRDRLIGRREVVTAQYPRIVFYKGLKEVPGSRRPNS